jgi:hypothetical protein
MKGYEEPTTTFIEILTIIIFTLFVLGSLLMVTKFRTDARLATTKRIMIDFGENVLSANCLTNEKNVLNETKIRSEFEYYKSNKDDKDGFSCLETSIPIKTIIQTEETKWEFGDAIGKIFIFPAVLLKDNGSTVPAIVTIMTEVD